MSRLSAILKKRSPLVNTLPPGRPVSEAVQVMAERHVGAVLVMEGQRLVGIFSERDLLRRVIAPGRALDETSLGEVMTRDPITAELADERQSAILKMKAVGCRHLPIVADGDVVDTVSIRDLLFDEIDEKLGEIEELKRYIQGT